MVQGELELFKLIESSSKAHQNPSKSFFLLGQTRPTTQQSPRSTLFQESNGLAFIMKQNAMYSVHMARGNRTIGQRDFQYIGSQASTAVIARSSSRARNIHTTGSVLFRKHRRLSRSQLRTLLQVPNRSLIDLKNVSRNVPLTALIA